MIVPPEAGWRDGVENGFELSRDRVARWLMIVKNNYLVIRMTVSSGARWRGSWWMERVCRERWDSKVVWKSLNLIEPCLRMRRVDPAQKRKRAQRCCAPTRKQPRQDLIWLEAASQVTALPRK